MVYVLYRLTSTSKKSCIIVFQAMYLCQEKKNEWELVTEEQNIVLTWSRILSCCPRIAKACWGYLFFKWSMKASRFRSISDFWSPVRASRLWAAITVCRRSEVCTNPTLENRRVPLPRVRYSRGYSASSAEIMWALVLSGSTQDLGGRKKSREGVRVPFNLPYSVGKRCGVWNV